MNIRNQDLALLLVRIVLGSTLALHGAQKLFGLFEGPGIHGWIKMVESLGLHQVLAYLSAGVEFFGGLMVLAGIATEIAAGAILINMLAAVYFVHMPHGYFLPNGMEYALNLALLCLAVVCGGAGRYTFGYLCKKC